MIASTIVDLPEPMSPVTSVFLLFALRIQNSVVEGAPVEQLEAIQTEAGTRLLRCCHSSSPFEVASPVSAAAYSASLASKSASH